MTIVSGVSTFAALVTYIQQEVASCEMSELQNPDYMSCDEGFKITSGQTVNEVVKNALQRTFNGAVGIGEMFVESSDNRTFYYSAQILRLGKESYKVCGTAVLHTTANVSYINGEREDSPTFKVRTYLVINWTHDSR